MGDLTKSQEQARELSEDGEQSAPISADSPQPNILIVDDNPNNLHLLCNILEGQEYIVRPANNGSLALRTMETLKPDLVLLDVNMPEMDGYQVCRAIKSNPDLESVPVIFISALSDIEDKVRAFEVGGQDYITKPFQVSEILARVKTHLALHDTKRALSDLNIELKDARDRLEDKVEERTKALTSSNKMLTEALKARDQAVRHTQRQKNFYHALSEMNRSVLLLDNPHALYMEATRIAVDYAGFTHSWVASYAEDEKGNMIEGELLAEHSTVSADSLLPFTCSGCNKSSSGSLIDEAFREGSSVVQRFVCCEDCPKRALAEEYQISMACFPIFIGDEPIATLNMCTDDNDLFDEDTKSLLKQMSSTISFGLNNYKREEEQESFNFALKKVVTGVVGSVGQPYLSQLVEHLAIALEFDVCSIYLREGDEKLRCHAQFARYRELQPPLYLQISESSLKHTLNNESLFVEKSAFEKFPYDVRATKNRLESMHAVPIRGKGGEIVGALEAINKEPLPASSTLMGMLSLFALRIGTELQRIELERTLRNHAEDLERLVDERTEELHLLNKELESFSYTVSHDLRAPLRAIDGFSNALVEDYGDKLDEQAQEYLSYLKESSYQMAAMIDGLLELSRSSRGDLDIDEVNLSEIVEDILSKLRLEQSDRKVEQEVEPNLLVSGDLRLLSAVLTNLVENAWKYTEGREIGRIEFGKTTIVAENQKEKTCYFIRDNGAGFNMDYQDNLFKPFQRLHRQSDFSGTGIGLATVKRIISRHGGSIWAEAVENEGATFYFTLSDSHDNEQAVIH